MHAPPELEDEIVALFAEVFAVTSRALTKLATFDASEQWSKLG